MISSDERDALEQYAADVDDMDAIDDDDIDVNSMVALKMSPTMMMTTAT